MRVSRVGPRPARRARTGEKENRPSGPLPAALRPAFFATVVHRKAATRRRREQRHEAESEAELQGQARTAGEPQDGSTESGSAQVDARAGVLDAGGALRGAGHDELSSESEVSQSTATRAINGETYGRLPFPLEGDDLDRMLLAPMFYPHAVAVRRLEATPKRR